jgi:hypothetical protein
MVRKLAMKDPLGQHIRLHAKLYNSPAWCVLSPSAKALWCDLRTQTNTYNNGSATTALGVLAHKGWSSRHTVMRARNELTILGFIEITHQGGICNGGKSPNLYRFTDQDMYEQPKWRLSARKADHLYLRFKTKLEAQAEIRKIEKSKKNVKVPNQHLISKEMTPRSRKLSVELAH